MRNWKAAAALALTLSLLVNIQARGQVSKSEPQGSPSARARGGFDIFASEGLFLERNLGAPGPDIPVEPVPDDAKALIATFDSEAAATRRKVEQEIQTRRLALIEALQTLQDKYVELAKPTDPPPTNVPPLPPGH